MSDLETRFHQVWLGMVQPAEGLVVSVPVLVDAECMQKQPPELQERLLAHCVRITPPKRGTAAAEAGPLRIRGVGALFADLLGLTPDLFDRESALPEELTLYVPEGGQTIRPTMALRAMEEGAGHVALVWQLPDGLDLDKPETATGPWEYPPSAKLDRLLRHARVPIGILTNAEEIRLVYAPHGESSGSITFRLADMATVGGRPILDAMVMLLSATRFFGVAKERQLPAILAQSRMRQANVTSELANQVFEGLEALLRGFENAADRDRTSQLREALERGDDHVYAALLTVLLRLVFVLYAEDRGLLPTSHAFYSRELSVLALYEELVRDQGSYPDAMSRRFGAWGRLVALFRAVYLGVSHGDLQMPAKRGELFDPNTYPFLEGWGPAGSAPVRHAESRAAVELPSVDDGTILTVLDKLIVFEGQRLSYRALDVEQIGSVYEALMGYHVLRVVSPSVCMRPNRVWISAEEVRAQKPAQRAAWLKETAGLSTAQATKLAEATAAAKADDAITLALEAFAVKGTALATEGRLVLQPGAERRRTSSHYTPRSLSAPIVRKTLAPLFACLAAGGDTGEAGAGKGPKSKDILSLSVCDPAMGSGAFLVEACRVLADELVAAWARERKLSKIAQAHPDVLTYARRLVAQSCLYGVDKNPYAVNLAKLSLWLLTLSKDESFSFVDHALRHGDSLVGLDFDQIRSFHWTPGKQLDLCAKELEGVLDEAVLARQKIQALAGDVSSNAQREKERLLYDAEDALDRARLLGDLVVGAFFSADKDKAREAERLRRFDLVRSWLTSGGPAPDELRELQREIRAKVPVFHWMVEFPEIFYVEKPDPLAGNSVNRAAFMDAFVGNPPFLGGKRISGELGDRFGDWLTAVNDTSKNTDICAHFFRRAFVLLGDHGSMGFVATNSLPQGDNREAGLAWILGNGGIIFSAMRSMPWPGDAAVSISVVHIARGLVSAVVETTLDGKPCRFVSSRLLPTAERPAPRALVASSATCFSGSYVAGQGFFLTSAQRAELIAEDANSATVIREYMGGEELLAAHDDTPARWVINFEKRSLEDAERWPSVLRIVRERVKPDREATRLTTGPGGHGKKYWWQYISRCDPLYEAILPLRRCLVVSQTAKHLAFAWQPTSRVFGHSTYVVTQDSSSSFAVLQSRIHECWARLHSSSLETRLRYTPSDCLETFPFPRVDPGAVTSELEVIGKRIYDARAAYMLTTRQGLTQTYNALKDASVIAAAVAELRALHEDLDRVVLAAYGWSDIAVPPFVTPETDEAKKRLESFEDEVIDRLFVLNAARAEEEAKAGLGAARTRPKPASKKSGTPKAAGKAPAPKTARENPEQEDLDIE
jgi:hypothetical protein